MKITEQQKQRIIQLRDAGLRTREISQIMELRLGTVEYYYYEYNKHIKQQIAEKKKKNAYKPMTRIDTCIIDGWRVPYNPSRINGDIAVRQATPEELDKFRKVTPYKKPMAVNINLGEHWERKRKGA